MKRYRRGKVFIKHISDKGLISRIHKNSETWAIKKRKSNNPTGKKGERQKELFYQKKHSDSKELLEKMFHVLVTSEIQLKGAMSNHNSCITFT